MTIGAYRGSSATPAPSVHRAKPFTLPSRSENASLARSQADTADMPPPPPRQGATSFTRDSTTSGVDIAQLRPGINEESLFVTEDDEEERRWGARTYEEDEGELRWVRRHPMHRDTETDGDYKDSGLDLRGNLAVPSNSLARQLTGKANEEAEDDNFVAPTQRMSQASVVKEWPRSLLIRTDSWSVRLAMLLLYAPISQLRELETDFRSSCTLSLMAAPGERIPRRH